MLPANVATQDLVGQELSACIPSGGPLDAYMRWAVPQYGAPPLYHLAVGLTCAVHELARRGFYLDGSSRVPMLVWSALVGPSGNGKSGAIRMGKDFLQSLWEESSNVPRVDPWVQLDGSLAGIFSSLQDFHDASRGTTVAMLYEEEFSSVLASRDAVAEFLCRLHDGYTQQKNLRELQRGNRNQARQDRIIEPRVSALLASTEVSLAPHFTEAMRRGGLFSRMWWVCPDPTAKSTATAIPAHLEGPYTAAVDSWLGWLVQLSMFETRGLRIGEDALKLWTEELYAALNQQGDGLGDDDAKRGLLLRTLERTKLFAVVFASLAGRSIAAPEDMQAALAVRGLMMAGSSRLQLLGANQDVRGAERVRRVIAEFGEHGRNRRELYQMHLSKRDLDAALDHLLDAQSIVEDRSGGRVRYYAVETERGSELAKRQPIPGQIVRLGKKPGSEDDDGSGKPN